VVSYIAGLADDEDEDMDDIVEMVRGMLSGGPSSRDPKPLDDLYVESLDFYQFL
jgi:ATP-binding cassette subfamily F protein 3